MSAHQFKSFISQDELEKRRKLRQEEWERVRKPDQPAEAPEEEYDGRSLYDRLKEQKDKKEAEFEEAHKLRNLVRGLNEDEVQFLDMVDRTKEKLDKKLRDEEEETLNEYRSAITLAEKEMVEAEAKPTISFEAKTKSCPSKPKSTLKVHIKRKHSEDATESSPKRTKEFEDVESSSSSTSERFVEDFKESKVGSSRVSYPPSAQVVAVLPGLVYSDSSDSEYESSDSDGVCPESAYDLLGRVVTADASVPAKCKVKE